MSTEVASPTRKLMRGRGRRCCSLADNCNWAGGAASTGEYPALCARRRAHWTALPHTSVPTQSTPTPQVAASSTNDRASLPSPQPRSRTRGFSGGRVSEAQAPACRHSACSASRKVGCSVGLDGISSAFIADQRPALLTPADDSTLETRICVTRTCASAACPHQAGQHG